jgi:hypothetical protein
MLTGLDLRYAIAPTHARVTDYISITSMFVSAYAAS